jgi:hypothetical protein
MCDVRYIKLADRILKSDGGCDGLMTNEHKTTATKVLSQKTQQKFLLPAPKKCTCTNKTYWELRRNAFRWNDTGVSRSLRALRLASLEVGIASGGKFVAVAPKSKKLWTISRSEEDR